jgi:hypothetical protein
VEESDVGQIAQAIWKLIAAGEWDAVAEQMHDDYVQEWPQSRERIVGKGNALAVNRDFPGGLPSMVFRRTLAVGDLAVLEVELTYGDGSVYQGVSIMEFRDGRLLKETDYFAQPFEAPQWRAQWVERM